MAASISLADALLWVFNPCYCAHLSFNCFDFQNLKEMKIQLVKPFKHQKGCTFSVGDILICQTETPGHYSCMPFGKSIWIPKGIAKRLYDTDDLVGKVSLPKMDKSGTDRLLTEEQKESIRKTMAVVVLTRKKGELPTVRKHKVQTTCGFKVNSSIQGPLPVAYSGYNTIS